ncbi:MAG: S-layer homology domain-containing protein [Clostridia bacterium]|nr:S-layer homology domain-containing protein [Clostridia bacterium]
MKKVLSVILAIMLSASTLTAVYAAEGDGKKDVGPHEHQLMKMANDACHYEECTICFELFNVGEHTFVDGKCSVCGNSQYDNSVNEEIQGEGEHEHIIIKTADENSHFDECTVCFERFGVSAHTMENGVCTVCGYPNMGPDVGEHEHQLMDMANMECHYSECTICFELFNVGVHTFKDGKCTVCGHDELINPFVDVPENAWYHDEVMKAVDTGIINGKTTTEFKPDDFLTYAEAVKLAACMNQVYLYGKVTLTNGTPWYQTYVDYCKENNIISKEYNYGENATRAGYMEIFANALPDEAFKDINNIPDGSILDVKNNSPYAIYVYKLYRAGIVSGADADHNCKPDNSIKRSEVAAIISRMMDEDKRVKFDMAGSNGKNPADDLVTEDTDINTEHEAVVVNPGETEKVDYDTDNNNYILSPLTIYKQPVGSDGEEYGSKYELEVQVYGGKAPYTYEWQYNGYRNQKTKIENGDYAKDANSAALILSIEEENTLLGVAISCKITDSEGTTVTTDAVKVYGPFSMPVDDWTLESGKNTLIGRVADGILKKGEKVSVIRDGKVIAIGVAEDLQMFNKSLDETVKGDNVGIVFSREDGARPGSGDIVVKYQPSHVVDTSDIIN